MKQRELSLKIGINTCTRDYVFTTVPAVENLLLSQCV